MCSLVKELLSLDIHNDDALVIQSNNLDELGVPNYSEAEALICRVDTDYGESWCYYSLVFINEKLMTMSTIHGTISDVVTAARFQFGKKLDESELLGVSYKNQDFPQHLIPQFA